jgi:hypothetical protein
MFYNVSREPSHVHEGQRGKLGAPVPFAEG